MAGPVRLSTEITPRADDVSLVGTRFGRPWVVDVRSGLRLFAARDVVRSRFSHASISRVEFSVS